MWHLKSPLPLLPLKSNGAGATTDHRINIKSLPVIYSDSRGQIIDDRCCFSLCGDGVRQDSGQNESPFGEMKEKFHEAWSENLIE